MKNFKLILGLVSATLLLTNCSSNENKDNTAVVNESQEASPNTTADIGMTIAEIDTKRAEIESLELEPLEVRTSELREKTRQKWSKIHFYVENGVVVKVKTYPHAEISKRTEEFYADENGLLLVVIEDNGDGPKGKPKNELDKLYYFNHGEIIDESNQKDEKEYSVKEGDAKELLTEFEEYIDVYKSTTE